MGAGCGETNKGSGCIGGQTDQTSTTSWCFSFASQKPGGFRENRKYTVLNVFRVLRLTFLLADSRLCSPDQNWVLRGNKQIDES